VIHLTESFPRRPDQDVLASNLLVEGLGVGGGGRNVGIAGSLVGAGGELELVGSLEVGVTGLAVGSGVVLEVEKLGDHLEEGQARVSNIEGKGQATRKTDRVCLDSGLDEVTWQ
jgi:hypothetical protein